MEPDYEPTVADHRAAQTKSLLEANRRPPSLVEVSRAVTAAALGRRRGDSGPACASVAPHRSCAPGPRPGVRHISGLTWDDASRYPPDTPRLLDLPRSAIALHQLRGLC
jgi:hypothetical protein